VCRPSPGESGLFTCPVGSGGRSGWVTLEARDEMEWLMDGWQCPTAAAVEDWPILAGFSEAVHAAGLGGKTTLAHLLEHMYLAGRADGAALSEGGGSGSSPLPVEEAGSGGVPV